MIGRHEFNSQWVGADVGIVTSDEFFDASEPQQRAQLAAWSWVEARGPLDARHRARVARAGFRQVDTQLQFRIGLSKLETAPSVERLDVRFADEAPFDVAASDLADFRHERFASLAGITMESLNRRYALWSRALIDAAPETCMQILRGDQVEGWFLGRRTAAGLELTLAMLARSANISGHLLYQRALVAYRDRGARVGHARFSASNTAVHNIYASLGARFVAPIGCWLWQSGEQRVFVNSPG